MAIEVTTNGSLVGGRVLVASDGNVAIIGKSSSGYGFYIWNYNGSTVNLDDSDDATTIHGNSAQNQISAAIDSNDTIHCISYINYNSVARPLAYNTATYSGGTWTLGTWELAQDYQEGNPGTTDCQCDIDVDSNDKPHVVYIDRVTSKGSGQIQIFYTEKTGASWSSPVQLSERPNKVDNCIFPKLSMKASDNIEVTYEANVYNAVQADDLAYITKTSGSWGSETLISTSVHEGSRRMVLVESDNTVHRYWQVANNAYEDSTSLGMNVYRTSASTTYSMHPSFYSNDDRYIFVVDNTDRDLYVYENTGSGWDSGTLLQSGITASRVIAQWQYLNNNLSANGIWYAWTESGYIYLDFLDLSTGTATSDSQSAWLAGGIEDNDNQYAFLVGGVTSNDSQSAYLSGSGGQLVTLQPGVIELSGSITPATDHVIQLQPGVIEIGSQGITVPGYLDAGSLDFWLNYRTPLNFPSGVGYDDGMDIWLNQTTPLKIKIKDKKPKNVDIPLAAGSIAIDSQGINVATNVLDNQSAYLEGVGGATDNQSAYLAGLDTTTDQQPAWLSGGINVTDNQTAFTSGGIESTDNQLAYAHGQEETNGQQSGYTRGSQSDSAGLSVYLAAWASTQASTLGYLVGQDTASETQAAYLRGWEHTSSDLPSYTAGSESLTDQQSGYLIGSLDDSDNQVAYLAGSQDTSDNQLAYLEGESAFTPVSDNQTAYLSGQDYGFDNIESYVSGRDYAFDNSIAYLKGQDSASSDQQNYLSGQDTANSSQDNYLAGGIIATDNQTAFIQGSQNSADNRDAYLEGYEIPWHDITSVIVNTGSIVSGNRESTWDNDDEYLVLAETTGSPGFSYDFYFGEQTDVPTYNLLANLYGYYSGNQSHNIKLQQYNFNTTNWDNVTSNTTDFPYSATEQIYQFVLKATPDHIQNGQVRLRLEHSSPGNINHEFNIDWFHIDLHGKDILSAYLKGQDNATDNQEAYSRGQSQANANLSGFTAGSENTSSQISAYLSGLDTSSDSSPAYLNGQADQTDSQNAYLAGQDYATSNTYAYAFGWIHDLSNQPAFIQGWNSLAGSQLSYLSGQDLSSSAVSAFIAGSSPLAGSQEAYLVGSQDTTDSISAYAEADAYEYLIPDGDSVVGGWENELGGTPLWSSIDDYPNIDDNDYVIYTGVSGGETFTVTLTDPEGNPFVTPEGKWTLEWRPKIAAGVSTITVKVEIFEGAALIASDQQVISDTWETFAYQLSPAEVASITDPTNLLAKVTIVSVI